MDCTDNYCHTNSHIMYFPRCIPTKEVEATIQPTTVFCNCSNSNCEENNCACIQRSGTYYSFTDKNQLESYKIVLTNKNRPTYECNENCQCVNSLCGNKLVQCGPRSGLIVKICEESKKGQGVFTEKSISNGNFVCEYAGEVISEREALIRFKINAKKKKMNYIFCIDEYFGNKNIKTFIDASAYGNIGRYVNHSCDPNCVMMITRINDNIPVLALFACRNIAVNEELSYDYGIINKNEQSDEDTSLSTKCLCGSETCSGFLPYDTRII
ncbi:hypothetical protein ABEB36_004674 [Hypothenemus hampei]|uniref:Histone-lysine N-methyltransferase set-23 n=1 Tax=Hypothenemus hampei TaxID=57062 RepID=A0ABD1F450_HYPHA